MAQKEIIIIGAGIVGVMLALRLSADSNVKITLVDKGDAGNGATQFSFAWLNVSYGKPDNYQRLRASALNAWHKLETEISLPLNIRWSGAISWQNNDLETAHFIESHRAQKFEVMQFSKTDLANKEPLLKSLPNISAFAPHEGAIDPIYVIHVLLEEAIARGVNYIPNTKILSLSQDETGKMIGVATANTYYHADQIILAAGIDNKALLHSHGVELPITASPSIIIRFKHDVYPNLTQHIISNPEMEIRSIDDEHLLAAQDYIDDAPDNTPQIIAKKALKTIQGQFSSSAPKLNIDKVALGLRPMPLDEMPIVGFIDHHQSLYHLSMHAAVTLSPLISQLAAKEILEKREEPALMPYRISRFNTMSTTDSFQI